MTMTQRKKLSKSGWILLGMAIVVPIVLITLHFTGIIDLSFIGGGYLAVMMWASDNGWNALIVGLGHIVVGALLFYGLKSYILGDKISTTTTGATPYVPQGQTVPAQQNQETEISS